MAIERTFAMLKPDGVQRGIVGKVIQRFEDKGLKIVALKMLWIDDELAGNHYGEHVEKPFFKELTDFITSGPVVAMVLEGDGAIDQVRTLMGATDPKKSPPGSIRGDFGMELSKNIVHGSDKLESAQREIGLFFNDSELQEYKRINEQWL
jgi:nucleoside-diphosphate kinase